ncbi:MAG: phosphocholine cytidylyltransferase family protein [Vicinamibacterales bacterium]
MSGPPQQAIILAAGMGTRLRSLVTDLPKGLIELSGETLVGRSVRLLGEVGIQRVTIVAGYAAEHYRAFAASRPGVHVVINSAYATTGSMASLAVALEDTHEDVLVLESDIVYERRALTALVDQPGADATLVSGPTGAGDEVWVWAVEGRLRAMSKRLDDLPGGATGEFVGITRLSTAAAAGMLDRFKAVVVTRGHGRMDYETDALVEVAAHFPILAVLVPDLQWGEIDDERHFERVARTVWPAISR